MASCLEGFSCRATSWLHFCLELWRDWNMYITLTYPTIVWRLSMNAFLKVWKASESSTWQRTSWESFHLKSFEISAVWKNLTCRATNWEHFQKIFFEISVAWANFICRATNWEHFQKVFFGISAVLKNLTWAITLWICFPWDSLRASGWFLKSTWAKTAWVSLRMSSLANFSAKRLKTSHVFRAFSRRRIWCMIVERLVQKTPWWNLSFKNLLKKSRVYSYIPVVLFTFLWIWISEAIWRSWHRFLWQPWFPPSSIFSISIFVGISQQKQLRVFFGKKNNSFSEDFGWPRPGRIWRFLERDVVGRPKLWIWLEISGCRLR